ncbi:hypothetical protein [Streptomyces sp.]|uniref:hypothetical protein n=1 Tax=Streptomyces sp. TaxID=1931 RepID=UPI002F3FEC0A
MTTTTGPYVPPLVGEQKPPAVRPSDAHPSVDQYDHRYGRDGRVPSRAPALVPPSGASPSPAPAGPAAQGQPGDQPDSDDGARGAMRVLPLGAGMVLVGLGLGFLGLRLRRS